MIIDRVTRELRNLRNDLTEQIGKLEKKVDKLQETGDAKYVTQAEFSLWKWAIGILVTVALTGVSTLLLKSLGD